MFYRDTAALLVKVLLLIVIMIFVFTDVLVSFKKKMLFYVCYVGDYCGCFLKNIVIEGQMNISLIDIIDALNYKKGESILVINLTQIKDRLESNFWIKNVIVQRRLPHTIYIKIFERQPIAIWQFRGEFYLIDSEGNCITRYVNKDFSELLYVIGDDANIYAADLYKKLKKYPNLVFKVQSAVRYGNRRWNLNFIQQIIVKMPEHDFDRVCHYLCALDNAELLFKRCCQVLDLRNFNRVLIANR